MLALVLLAPLGVLSYQAVLALSSDPSAARDILNTRAAGLWWQSVADAAAVALGGVILALLAASALWQMPAGYPQSLRWFFLALAPLPTTLHALAWITAAGWIGMLTQRVGMPAIAYRGWGWLVWVQIMALAPLATGLTLLGLQHLPGDLWDEARLLASPWKAFWKVAIPHSAPYLLAAGGLLFLLSLTDFSLPATFQVNVYAFEIFTTFSASNDSGRTFLAALPLCVVTLPAALLTSSRAIRGIAGPDNAPIAKQAAFGDVVAHHIAGKGRVVTMDWTGRLENDRARGTIPFHTGPGGEGIRLSPHQIVHP